MGCFGSRPAYEGSGADDGKGEGRKWRKPVWSSQEPLTAERLQKMREEFWDTQPHYGGDRVIWDALKAVCEAEDMTTAKLIIETAGIIVASKDLSICYDERGAKYEMPVFVISNPVNLQSQPS